MKFVPLYKRATNGIKINKWQIEVEDGFYRTISGYHDGVQTPSEWKWCEPKNVGKKNETSAEDQAIAEATSLFTKRKNLGFWENIADCDKKVFYQPMLAHELKDYIYQLTYPIYSQPKLDGIRCIIKSDGMWSRYGKPLISAPHIFKSLIPLFEENPDLILDGELYCDKLSNDFNKIISLARKSKPTKKALEESERYLEYHVYDVPSFEGTFSERYLYLASLPLSKYCKKVYTNELTKHEQIYPLYEQYMEQGYEGQIIRTNSIYQNKRSKYLLKYKETVTEEFVIEGVEEGRGNMSGKVGKLYFSRNGHQFDAAVNGDWEYLAKLLKRNDLIGKPATVRYVNLTPRGVPRFGKVIAIRDYE